MSRLSIHNTLGWGVAAVLLVTLVIVAVLLSPAAAEPHPTPTNWECLHWKKWREWRASLKPTTLQLSGAYDTIILTYKSLDAIPAKVYEQLDIYAPNHRIFIFDDVQCKAFLRKHYPKEVVARFDTLPLGAFKADLFRYAYLYVNGGIYLDIKTELRRPLAELFPDRTVAQSVICHAHSKKIYNGIIATPPGNPIFPLLIDQLVYVPNTTLKRHYHTVIEFCYAELMRGTTLPPSSELPTGEPFMSHGVPWVLWMERYDHTLEACGGQLDRYDNCDIIEDAEGNLVFMTRFADFGKAW